MVQDAEVLLLKQNKNDKYDCYLRHNVRVLLINNFSQLSQILSVHTLTTERDKLKSMPEASIKEEGGIYKATVKCHHILICLSWKFMFYGITIKTGC